MTGKERKGRTQLINKAEVHLGWFAARAKGHCEKEAFQTAVISWRLFRCIIWGIFRLWLGPNRPQV